MLTSGLIHLLSSPTIPTVDPSGYGQRLLDGMAAQLPHVLPYAAAFTAFSVGLGFVSGWLGRRRATAIEKDRRDESFNRVSLAYEDWRHNGGSAARYERLAQRHRERYGD